MSPGDGTDKLLKLRATNTADRASAAERACQAHTADVQDGCCSAATLSVTLSLRAQVAVTATCWSTRRDEPGWTGVRCRLAD